MLTPKFTNELVRFGVGGMEVFKMAKTLKVTLIRSTIGAVPKNKATVEAMGLTKLHKTFKNIGYSTNLKRYDPQSKSFS